MFFCLGASYAPFVFLDFASMHKSATINEYYSKCVYVSSMVALTEREYLDMLIDFHTHLFPPEILKYREHYCERDPWFNALYANPKVGLASAEDLVAEMETSGVDISVTFSFGWTDAGLIEETNSYVIDAMRRYPGRIYGMAVLQPTDIVRSIHELERCAQAGMIGLGELMPHGQGYKLSDI